MGAMRKPISFTLTVCASLLALVIVSLILARLAEGHYVQIGTGSYEVAPLPLKAWGFSRYQNSCGMGEYDFGCVGVSWVSTNGQIVGSCFGL